MDDLEITVEPVFIRRSREVSERALVQPANVQEHFPYCERDETRSRREKCRSIPQHLADWKPEGVSK